MSETTQCAAMTQAGTQCKNSPQEGSIYCHVHRNYEAAVASDAVATPIAPAATAAAIAVEEEMPLPAAEPVAETVRVDEQPTHARSNEAFDKLVHELNQIAEQLRQRFPGYQPPDYTPYGLLVALRENADRIAPGLHLKQSRLLSDLEEELEGKRGQDFLDVETWSGLWYVFSVALQSSADQLRSATAEQMERMPDTMTELRQELEIHRPTDLLAMRTWKNVYRFSQETLKRQVEKLRNNGDQPAG